MNKNFGIGILILCFGLSSVDAARATQSVDVPPIIVQPYDLNDINQQMMEQDRINRDQELAIRGLIDDNQNLVAKALAVKQDATLDKINQTMINYRDYLLSRDHARIEANGQRVSKYHDLIVLTEDVDDMKDADQTLQFKSNVIEDKYKILTELKSEMTALNEKLRGQETQENHDQISSGQEDKIQMLTDRLADMDQRISRYDEILAEKDRQIAQLKENLAMLQSEAASRDETIKQQEGQIAVLQGASKGNLSLAANSMELSPIIVNAPNNQQQAAAPQPKVDTQAQIIALKDKIQWQYLRLKSKDEAIHWLNQVLAATKLKNNLAVMQNEGSAAQDAVIKQQASDLKVRDESIRWLNQVLAATKNKVKYYKLTAMEDRLSMRQIQGQVQQIEDNFAQRFKNYDQFENGIVSLKDQVGRLGLQLSQKQDQVDLLKSELKNKAAQNQQGMQAGQDLKAQLQDKENQVVKMKADILAILQAQANKEIYLRGVRAQADDRVNLAKELIGLQQQEAMLLNEKNDLEAAGNALFDKRLLSLEKKVNGLLIDRQTQITDLKSRMEVLKGALDQKGRQLKATQTQADAMGQQLADQQNKLDSLKQEIDGKNAQSTQMTLMMSDYQKKLESKDNAYNQQMGQVLSFKNAQARMQAEIADLNTQLQQKEAQVVRIKKNMYDLQKLASAKNLDIQTRDLDLSMIQQKVADEKIKEYQDKIKWVQAVNDKQAEEVAGLKADLALARQQLSGMPSSDEISFLRTGLKKATVLLAQKDAMLAQIKVNAAEYEKEFKAQTGEFQSVKEQLQDAYDDLYRKNEDLKYKNMEVIRLKERSVVKEGDLQDQIKALTRKLNGVDKKSVNIIYQNKTEEQVLPFSKDDPLEGKLKQALDKMDEQGRVINALVAQLQECGKSVDLTKIAGEQQ